MKKQILMLFAVVFSFTAMSFAQGNPNAKMKPVKLQKVSVEQKAINATDTMQKVAQLSKEQYQQILAINQDFFKQQHTIKSEMRKDTSANDIAFKEQLIQLSKSRKASINKLLTETQKTVWKDYKKMNMTNKKNKSSKQDMFIDDESLDEM